MMSLLSHVTDPSVPRESDLAAERWLEDSSAGEGFSVLMTDSGTSDCARIGKATRHRCARVAELRLPNHDLAQ